MPMYVGIDLVCLDEIRESLETHGDRYLRRIYTARERLQCGQSVRRLAGRFAAKEATMKALGGSDPQLPWNSIEVLDAHGGALAITLNGAAQRLVENRGVRNLSVSVTHRRSLAAALVLAERGRCNE
ncbi:MAG TPA: holo-ACP synthase [Solirubrobacteraceae bacterium]